MRNSQWLWRLLGIIFFIMLLSDFQYSWILIILAAAVIFQRKNYPDFFKKIFKQKNMPEVINMNPNMDKVLGNLRKTIVWIVAAVVVVVLLANAIVIIDAGYTGVYSLFGKVKDKELSSGFHLINPFAKVTDMSIRTEEYTMSLVSSEGKKSGNDTITALTKEGLNVDLDITVLYHLSEQSASDVYKNVGLNYEDKIIRPAIRSAIRQIIAQYEAKDIYSVKRSEAAQRIADDLKVQMEPRGIALEEVLLRNVQLPSNLAQSIQEKLQAEQEAQKYDFILQREEKEKERKIIEAEGQRDAQTIINQSLTTNYLYYLYINQLKDREGTIYVPTSPDTGLPLFRGVGQ